MNVADSHEPDLEIAVNAFFLIIIVGFTVWIFFRSLKNSDEPLKLIFKWIFTLAVMGMMMGVAIPWFRQGGFAAVIAIGLAGTCGVAMTITWRDAIIGLVANPIASLYDGVRAHEIEPEAGIIFHRHFKAENEKQAAGSQCCRPRTAREISE